MPLQRPRCNTGRNHPHGLVPSPRLRPGAPRGRQGLGSNQGRQPEEADEHPRPQLLRCRYLHPRLALLLHPRCAARSSHIHRSIRCTLAWVFGVLLMPSAGFLDVLAALCGCVFCRQCWPCPWWAAVLTQFLHCSLSMRYDLPPRVRLRNTTHCPPARMRSTCIVVVLRRGQRDRLCGPRRHLGRREAGESKPWYPRAAWQGAAAQCSAAVGVVAVL